MDFLPLQRPELIRELNSTKIDQMKNALRNKINACTSVARTNYVYTLFKKKNIHFLKIHCMSPEKIVIQKIN